MDIKETVKILWNRRKMIFWMTVLVTVVFFDLMLIQPAKYKASARVLVVQKQRVNQDVYTASKSAQTLSKILQEGIYSDSFFAKVVESPFDVETSDFPKDPEDRKEEWEDTVNVSIVRDLGLMEIDVLYPDKEKAEQISQAVVSILKENHELYHGAGSNVEIRVLDYPVVEDSPEMTKLYLAIILGAAVGFTIGASMAIRKATRIQAIRNY